MVVAAETGSGKTHGYLVPLIHKLDTENELTHNALQIQEIILDIPVSIFHYPIVICEANCIVRAREASDFIEEISLDFIVIMFFSNLTKVLVYFAKKISTLLAFFLCCADWFFCCSISNI